MAKRLGSNCREAAEEEQATPQNPTVGVKKMENGKKKSHFSLDCLFLVGLAGF